MYKQKIDGKVVRGEVVGSREVVSTEELLREKKVYLYLAQRLVN